MSFFQRYTDAALEACWLIAAALVPLYFDLLRSQPFMPKGLLLQVLATLMVLLWLVQRAAARRATPPADAPEPAGAPWLFVGLAAAVALTTLLATALAPVPGVALWGSYLRGGGALATLSYLVLFLVVADRLRTRAQLDRLVTVLLAASVPVCLYGLAQALQLDPITWERPSGIRVSATTGNPIFLGGYLILLLPLTAWRLWEAPPAEAVKGTASLSGVVTLAGAVSGLAVLFVAAVGRPQGWWAAPALLAAFALLAALAPPLPADAAGRRLRRAGYAALLLLQLAVLGLTASLGPLFALGGALLAGLGVVAVHQRRWRLLGSALGAIALAVGFVAVLNLPQSPLTPLKERVVLLARLGALEQTGARPRLTIWHTTLQGLWQPLPSEVMADPVAALRPLVGYGPESIVFVINRVLPPPQQVEAMLGELWDRSHNALLDGLVTTGILGLMAYLALVGGVLAVTLRHAWRELAGGRPGLQLALLVALLSHLLEIQFSMLVLPGEALFWLLAGVAIAPLWRASAVRSEREVTIATQSPAGGRRVRRAGRASRPLAPAPPVATPWWPVGAYGGLALLGAVVLLLAPPPEALLAATGASLSALVLAPFAGALALTPPPWPRAWPTQAAALAGALLLLTLVLSQHQLGALAAEVAFKRAETAHGQNDYPGAIAAAQQAVRLAPDQAEYLHVLGQYYAAFGGLTHAAPLTGFTPSLAEALTTTRATLLGRDQLFALGRLSIEEALRLDPLEARYYLTLGELYRYWAEVANEPAYTQPAIAWFERAAVLKPNDVEIYAGIADALLLAGDPERAVATARYATTLLTTYWYPYAVLAHAYTALGRPAEAWEAAQTALAYASLTTGTKSPSPYELSRLRAVTTTAQPARQ